MIITVGILYFSSLLIGVYYLSVLGCYIDDKRPAYKEGGYCFIFPLVYALIHSLISLQLLYNYLK